jgi:hypothetical protein
LACFSASEGGEDGEEDEDGEQIHRSGRHIKVSSVRGSSSVADPEGIFWPNPIRNRNKRFGSGFESGSATLPFYSFSGLIYWLLARNIVHEKLKMLDLSVHENYRCEIYLRTLTLPPQGYR